MKINRKTKKLHYNIFIICLILIVPVFLVKEYFVVRAKKGGSVCPVEDFYHRDLKPVGDKSFTFVVLTRNNIESIHLNFHSICRQSYLNYRIIYIDRGSTDGTLSSIRSFVKSSPFRVSLVVCEGESEGYQKYFEVVNDSPKGEVIVHLRGSDWLAHRDVLSHLNRCYVNHGVWLTYGYYLNGFDYKERAPCPKRRGLFHKIGASRQVSWVSAPFKSFYSALFREILEDSAYFPLVKDERSLLAPIAKIGRAHIGCIPGGVVSHGKGP